MRGLISLLTLFTLTKRYKNISLPKRKLNDSINIRESFLCPLCYNDASITEQGLCESCGNIVF